MEAIEARLAPYGGWRSLNREDVHGSVNGSVGLEPAVKCALKGGAAQGRTLTLFF